jgi:hypothetical protein
MRHFSTCLLSLALALAPGEPALSQEASKTGDAPGGNQDTDGEIRPSQVVIDGATLFSVPGVTAFPAERRAREIADRTRALTRDPKIAANSLALEEAEIEQSLTLGTLADAHSRRIAEAIEYYRNARRPVVLWSHAVYAWATFVPIIFRPYWRSGIRSKDRDIGSIYRTGSASMAFTDGWRIAEFKVKAVPK